MVFMNSYVVYKKESHQSSDDEGVDTYNPPAPESPADQSISIDNNVI